MDSKFPSRSRKSALRGNEAALMLGVPMWAAY